MGILEPTLLCHINILMEAYFCLAVPTINNSLQNLLTERKVRKKLLIVSESGGMFTHLDTSKYTVQKQNVQQNQTTITFYPL